MKVLVSIIKNELEYVQEWADWHLSLGFDKIYLFEDIGSTPHFIDNTDIIIDSVLKYSDGSRKNILATVINNFLEDHPEVTWIAFFDVDEFLQTNVDELIHNFPDGCHLLWKMFNANGHTYKLPGLVQETFTKTCGFLSRDYPKYCYKTLAPTPAIFIDPHTTTKKLTLVTGKLNHYFTKSLEEFCKRIYERKDIYYRNYRTIMDFLELNPEFTYDYVWNFIKVHYPEIYKKEYMGIDAWINPEYISKDSVAKNLLTQINLKRPKYILNFGGNLFEHILKKYTKYNNFTLILDLEDYDCKYKLNMVILNNEEELFKLLKLNIFSKNCCIFCKNLSNIDALPNGCDITKIENYYIINYV